MPEDRLFQTPGLYRIDNDLKQYEKLNRHVAGNFLYYTQYSIPKFQNDLIIFLEIRRVLAKHHFSFARRSDVRFYFANLARFDSQVTALRK